MWRIIRPDAISVWNDEVVKERLNWYYSVMVDKMPAKFMICKKIEAENPKKLDIQNLWDLHDKLSKEFDKIFRDVKSERIKIELVLQCNG